MRVLVVADDLTGANAAGALFARRGLRATTVLEAGAWVGALGDVAVADTDSRHLPPAEAGARVAAALERGPEAALVVKRIDTTLRGNVGAELEAALGTLRSRRECPVRTLCLPAFPGAGRTTVGGRQLVEGIPLAESEAGRDRLAPVPTSRVAEILATQTALRIEEVPLEVVEDASGLGEALRAGADVVVCDAVTERHLREVAGAAAAVAPAGGWLSVDPGPFGVELAGALGLLRDGPVLVVAGSVTELSRRQLDLAVGRLGARLVNLDPSAADPTALAGALGELAAAARPGEVIGVRTAGPPQAPDVGAEGAARILATLAGAARAVVEGHPVGALYLTGGDVARAVCDALGAVGLVVEEEVVPLGVAGRVVGGRADGTPVVTKGGLVGGEDAAVACLRYLRRRIGHER